MAAQDPKKGEQVIPITSASPDLIKPPVGYPFTAYCSEAVPPVKELIDPGITEFSDTLIARCWNLHSMAKEVQFV
ncbi:oligopeptide/dipeptide ABC transporter ATPase subunit [Paenibacillus sp. FSL R7-277]|uniref:hypothetical protein n=1 Tax=Paenibacillus sp. FSL P2-0089 TaxID=2954526 RepID=UPI0003E1C3F5|nr:hypothetical protein [Paenibacillus sp. FSL R7-277]ETT74307.1 oligopeptide/dipeptide ABC transporter ATPase subunit [Paenibacillus sp. FSL R7-277]